LLQGSDHSADSAHRQWLPCRWGPGVQLDQSAAIRAWLRLASAPRKLAWLNLMVGFQSLSFGPLQELHSTWPNRNAPAMPCRGAGPVARYRQTTRLVNGSVLLMHGSNGLTKTPGAGGPVRVWDIPQPLLAGAAVGFSEFTFQQP
jgi:hypothetical protein